MAFILARGGGVIGHEVHENQPLEWRGALACGAPDRQLAPIGRESDAPIHFRTKARVAEVEDWLP